MRPEDDVKRFDREPMAGPALHGLVFTRPEEGLPAGAFLHACTPLGVVSTPVPKRGGDAENSTEWDEWATATGHGMRADEAPSLDRDDAPAPVFVSLRELQANPDMLKPPECIVPRLVYRGRVTMLAGADKSGKSTLVAHAAAAVTNGTAFLGDPTNTRTCRVLWVGLEEDTGDAVRRFHELGAHPDHVALCVVGNALAADLVAEMTQALDAGEFDVVVVDSVQEYARTTTGETPSDGDNAAWGNVVRPLVAMARRYRVGMILLHHVRRSDGKARGAGEILAAVDVLWEMSNPEEGDPRVRRLKGRGRWETPTFEVILEAGRYRLNDGGEISLDAQVLNYVRTHGPCSRNAVRQGLNKKHATVLAAINSLVNAGTIMEDSRGLTVRGPSLA